MTMTRTYTVRDGAPSLTEGLAAKGDGRHQLDVDLDGAKIFAVVKDGRITGYEGERDGQPIETVTLQEIHAPGERMARRCYLCACSGDSCTCIPIDC
ncbi:hypothetical protein [Sinomonas flava]|uniref:hypothetical protein n=1 Tax=Sinomonas flava TaxID=496857 RepID=UPI0039A6B98C